MTGSTGSNKQTDSSQTVKQPREFKFVGSYCRKRRRRGPPNTTTADGQPSPPTTSASSTRSSNRPSSGSTTAKGSASRSSRANRSSTAASNTADPPNTVENQQPPGDATVTDAPETEPLFDNATVTVAPPPNDDVGQMPVVTDDVDVDVNRLVEAMGTSYDNLMNPFLYPSNQFLLPTEQLGFPNPQIPLFLESGTDHMTFGDSSMDEGSSIGGTAGPRSNHHDGPDAEEEEVQGHNGEFPTADQYMEGISLPSNISYAITQLLNRCKHHSHSKLYRL